MYSISLCMIVKDEEAVICRCLDSVRDLVDEIIIVDTGSSDRTKALAAEYTENIFDFPWIDDFAAARNFSFSKATKDFILWLDADDVFEEEDRKSFRENRKALDLSVSMVMMKYHTAFDENGRPTFSYYRERLLQRRMNHRWVGAIHEVILRRGKTIYWETAVTHKKLVTNDPDRNLRIFEKLIAEGKTLDERQQFYYGRELLGHGQYEKAVGVLEGFLQSEYGWVENKITACQDLSACYLKLEEEEKAAQALFRSFLYDRPRAEVCCDIGRYFLQRRRYEPAVYWYKAALECRRDAASGGFFSPDCYDFIPYLQLCVCYDRMGDLDQAFYYHKKSQLCKPENPSVLYNEKYFESKRKEREAAGGDATGAPAEPAAEKRL